MSCNFTKLEYLENTKRIFRETIDPKGTKISDNTPFRDYAKFMGVSTPEAVMIFSGDTFKVVDNTLIISSQKENT